MLDKWILQQLLMYLLATITVCGCIKSKTLKIYPVLSSFFRDGVNIAQGIHRGGGWA